MSQESLELAAALYLALMGVGFTRWVVGMAQRAYLLSTMKAAPPRPAPDAKKRGGDREAGS